MKISIIGSGNVATVLGRLLKRKDFSIEEIFSRDKIHAEKLAQQLNANAIEHPRHLSKNSDVYIIAVNDDAVQKVSDQLNVDEKVVVHTCGSASINILNRTSKNFGVLYPLQSLRKEIDCIPVIPFLIDANNEQTKSTIRKIATSLSNSVTEANDEQRLRYHLSAVIVSNFTNHLFVVAEKFCKKNNLSFSFLLPLIEEVVHRLEAFNPVEMQTGPAVRGDVSTIEKHLNLLKDFPQLKNIYKSMSESIFATRADASKASE